MVFLAVPSCKSILAKPTSKIREQEASEVFLMTSGTNFCADCLVILETL